jgi:hypothetical protein
MIKVSNLSKKLIFPINLAKDVSLGFAVSKFFAIFFLNEMRNYRDKLFSMMLNSKIRH